MMDSISNRCVKSSLLLVLLGLWLCWLAPLDGKSTGALTRNRRQFFGVANMYPGKKYRPSCPQCDVCPVTCPATSKSAFYSMNINTGDCTGTSSGASNFGRCTNTTGAPSGTLSVAFQTGSTAVQPFRTAFFGILATSCPNNTVTMQCGSIPSGISVITQNKIVSDGLSAVATPPAAVETGSMQVIMQHKGTLATLPANIVCTWTISP